MSSQQHGMGGQQNHPGQQPMRTTAAETKLPSSNLAIASTACLWLSVVAFLGAGTFVAVSGIDTLGEFQNRGASQQPTATVGEPKGRQRNR